MVDVFISYARENRAVAARVADELRGRGFSVWLDDDLPAHRTYSEVIEQRLREARSVAVLWSKASVGSQWVRAEADFGRNADKLVQARLDSTMPPLPFNQIECADLKGWRGKPDHRGWAKLVASVAALVTGAVAEAAPSKPRRRSSLLLAALGIGVIAVLAALAAYLLSGAHPGDAQDKPVVAVLPFDSGSAADESLVSGIWDDTRQALSTNPQLVVLGPHTSQELAERGARTARKAADYFLEGRVQSAGSRIRVNVSLTRSKDGVQIWSETFDRPLDDIFAVQSAIADEIEGHIRGRLAQRGGIRPENIATSGEVYALYSDATAKLREGSYQDGYDVYRQLQQVVQKDPNYAPGWAALSIAGWYTIYDTDDVPVARDLSETQARRAIALAPNLAQAHAALGLSLRQGPAAQAELRQALDLDPNNSQALDWLTATLNPYTQGDELLELARRGSEIEPLSPSPVLQRVDVALRHSDLAAAQAELDRVTKLGDEELAVRIRMALAQHKRDLSTAASTGLAYYRRADPRSRDRIAEAVALVMMRLGLLDQAKRIFNPEGFAPLLRESDPRSLPMIEERISPRLFWRISGLQTLSGRIYLATHRPEGLVRYYRAVTASADQFAKEVVGPEQLPRIAPTMAIALTQTGSSDEGQRLLQLAEATLGDAPRTDLEARAFLARIRAAQGRRDEAVALLASAVDGGWLPDFYHVPMDLSLDPPLALIRTDPRFRRVRQRVLDYVAAERKQLGAVAVK